jgi:hypothetical protein
LEYHREASGLDAIIILPNELAGTFVFDGKSWPLKPGTNHVQTK